LPKVPQYGNTNWGFRVTGLGACPPKPLLSINPEDRCKTLRHRSSATLYRSTTLTTL